VLPKETQAFIRGSMAASTFPSFHRILADEIRTQHRPTVILADTTSGLHSLGGEMVYAQYVRHLEKTSHVVQAAQKLGTVENFAQGYQDYLQAPLQVSPPF